MYTHEWLFKCYEGLKQYDSAHYHFKRMVRLKDSMNQSANAIAIRNLTTKYNFEQKERELGALANKNSKLQSGILAILPLLGLVTILLVLSFLLYRRFKNKNVILEDEKSETLQKLDELKNIVIKNHIVLKDRTRVYISDFMYVKSDDHYLQVFLSNGKKHFVRGKLKQIREELPPNFIQCHRSYIVNSNFIKKINRENLILIDNTIIPISRSFRGHF